MQRPHLRFRAAPLTTLAQIPSTAFLPVVWCENPATVQSLFKHKPGTVPPGRWIRSQMMAESLGGEGFSNSRLSACVCVCVCITIMGIAHKTPWFSYQCKEQPNPHLAECFNYSYSWSWHSRPSELWSSLLFLCWLIYILNQKGKEIPFCVSVAITWESLNGTLLLRRILRLRPDSAGGCSSVMD